MAYTDDIKLHHEETGSGDVLIFMHGNGQDSRMFNSAVEYFKDGYKCVTADSRAHGLSDPGSAELTIPLLSEDTIKFIDSKGYENITLIGFSDGGNIALEVASASAKVKNVVAVGANLYYKGLTFSARAGIRFTYTISSLFPFSRKAKRIRRLYPLMIRQPEITSEKLSRITARTLIVAGTKDMVRTSHTMEINKKIPSSEMVLFKDAGHFLFEKNSDELLPAIRKFIEER